MIVIPTITDYVAGDSLVQMFIVRNQATGGRENLTGATVVWSIAPGTWNSPGAAVLTLASNTSGVAITDAVNGMVQVTVTDDQFTGTGSFVQELEVTLANGQTYTVGRGMLQSAIAVVAA